MDTCLFCKIIKGDETTEIIFETNDFICIVPLEREAPGHTLIVSKTHYSNLIEAPPSIGASLVEVCQALAREFNQSMHASSFIA